MTALILAIPQQTDILEIDCDQDWVEAFTFSYYDTDGVTVLARSFAACTVIGGLATNPKALGQRFDLTSTGDAPNLTIAGNVVTVRVARDDIKILTDGTFNFGLTMVDADGGELGLIAGQRKLTHGVLL